MFRIFIASFFVIGFLTSGCKTERSVRPHQGCQQRSLARAGISFQEENRITLS